MVHPGGRPREHDRMKVVEEFVEWALNTRDAFTVPQFCAPRGFSSDTMLTWCKEDEQFRRSYNIAKELIGINRLKATLSDSEIKLDKSIYLKCICNYDFDQKHHDREEKAFESKLKQDEIPSSTPEQSQKLKAIIDQLSEMQSESKSARSNIKSDSQS